jgi:hypothetical protein
MVEARELWVELMARLAHTLSIDLGGARDPPVRSPRSQFAAATSRAHQSLFSTEIKGPRND